MIKRHEPSGSVRPMSPVAIVIAGVLFGGSIAACASLIGGGLGVVAGVLLGFCLFAGTFVVSYVIQNRGSTDSS